MRTIDRQNEYRGIKGWYKAVILPHTNATRLYKYRAETKSGWEVLFWSSCADTVEANKDFEQHYEPVKSSQVENIGIPFVELPVGHYFSFVLPGFVSDYSFEKCFDSSVKPLCVQPPEFDNSTIVEDLGPTLVTMLRESAE